MTTKQLYVFVTLILAAHVSAADDSVDAVKRGQPKDVVEFIDRVIKCAHWSGEEPYDADRTKQILSAEKKLNCARLKADETSILKKYTGNKSVSNAIKSTKK